MNEKLRSGRRDRLTGLAAESQQERFTGFDGMKVTGWPLGTIVRGHVVMQDGGLLGEPIGVPVNFQDTISVANRAGKVLDWP